MRGWRVWTSSAVYQSTTHDWVDVPDDVQVLVTYEEPPYRVYRYGVDEYAIPGEPVKLGKWMDEAAFEAIRQEAHRIETL